MTFDQRKILEAAAKACGIECEIECFPNDRCIGKNRYNEIVFDPLANPADCAEMCAKLRISVLYEYDPCEFLACFAHNSHDPEIAYYKDHDNSRLRAWMFAATMVAAKECGIEELEGANTLNHNALRLQKEKCDALQADNARLREALEHIKMRVSNSQLGHAQLAIRQAIASTPKQSLAEYRNKVIEECAVLCDERAKKSYLSVEKSIANGIRAMKEQP